MWNETATPYILIGLLTAPLVWFGLSKRRAKRFGEWLADKAGLELPDPDPLDDPDYQLWLSTTAANCQCCSQCSDCPCGGCLAGGICDARECRCERDRWDDFDDAYPDYGGDDDWD